MRPPTMVARRVYWLAATSEERVRQKAQLLGQHGFDVKFFSDFSSFATQLAQIRPAIVVVSDADDTHLTKSLVEKVATMPEIRTAKMILVCSHFDEGLSSLACSHNFRDILPLDAPSTWSQPADSGDDPPPAAAAWIQRFIYATSARPKTYHSPACQVSTALPATIGVAARITWISASHMGIETRLRPQIGSQIAITGALAAWYKIPEVSARIESSTNQKLRYHYSRSYTVSWTPPPGSEDKTRKLLAECPKMSEVPRARVYVAIQNAKLRQVVLKSLDRNSYEVAAALQKQAIAEEPQFFTPDYVILESAFATKENLRLIVALMASLTSETVIVILGTDSLAEQLKILYPHHTFVLLEAQSLQAAETHVPRTLAKFSSSTAKTNDHAKTADRDAHDVPPSHPLSQAELRVPGSLVKLHPTALQIQMDQPVATYALIRVIHPHFVQLFQRHLHAKITSSQKLERETGETITMPYVMDCYLADVSSADSRVLGRYIWDYVRQGLARFVSGLEEVQGSLSIPSAPPEQAQDLVDSLDPNRPSTTPESTAPKSQAPAPTSTNASPSLSTSPAKTRKSSPRNQVSPTQVALDLAKTAVIVGGGILGLWLLYTWLSARVEHSGSVYSEQLRRFAPHGKEEQSPRSQP